MAAAETALTGPRRAHAAQTGFLSLSEPLLGFRPAGRLSTDPNRKRQLTVGGIDNIKTWAVDTQKGSEEVERWSVEVPVWP